MLELENLLSIPIMCIFAFFASNAFDLYMENSKIEDQCKNYKYDDYNNSNYNNCIKDKNQKLNELKNKKFIFFIVIGIISIILAYYIQTLPAKGGIAGGGVLLILYGLIVNWTSMDDKTKLLVLGGGLSTLITVSYKYYS